MIEVHLEARLALSSIIEADAADLAVHPETPLDEPADEVEATDGEAIDRGEGEEEMQGEVEDGFEDREEGHEGGVDDDCAGIQRG